MKYKMLAKEAIWYNAVLAISFLLKHTISFDETVYHGQWLYR